jgi:plastocyanin
MAPRHKQRIRAIVTVAATLAATVGFTGIADAARPTHTLVIGVDHADPANETPDRGRVFEYTDFFSRNVVIHEGDLLDFRSPPNTAHAPALATSEAAARAVYPVVSPDSDDSDGSSGAPKLLADNAANFPIVGGSTKTGGGFVMGTPACGSVRTPCTFRGRDDVESVIATPAANQTFDWVVRITAAPGRYAFFCFFHPGMRGQLRVVAPKGRADTQADINRSSAAQFRSDRQLALTAEAAASKIRSVRTAAGTTYNVSVGVPAAQNHISVTEMLPNRPLHARAGDRVTFTWRDPHEIHSVVFPDNDNIDPAPVGFDCGPVYEPFGLVPVPAGPPGVPCPEAGSSEVGEVIFDPGNASSGSSLRAPAVLTDSGILVGRDYGAKPIASQWSVSIDALTQPGSYTFHCTIHDWMTQTIIVS